MPKTAAPDKRSLVRRFFSVLGPGLITGAADDDPSGIATYSIAGAQMGTSMLWTAFITWPFMACVQFMCARIGMVTGMGLGDALRRKGPQWLMFCGAVGLLVANTINVGSDLLAMADAGQMLSGVNSHLYVVTFGIGIAYATVRFRYHQIATIMKWLAAVLFAYVITAFIAGPDWKSVLRDTFIPSWPRDHAAWQNLVAVLGTTISPYLFFWQASQEVEEEKAMGRRMLVQRQGATKREIIDRKIDVAYAFAETFSWKEGLDEPLRAAGPFYAVLIFSMLLGIAMDLLRINPIKALFWTAIINGLLAPLLLVGILLVASDRKLMQDQPSSWLSRIAVGIVMLAMFGAAAAMFIL